MKNLKYISFLIILAISFSAYSQEEEKPDKPKEKKEKKAKEEKKKEKPVYEPWSCGRLIDNQTVVQTAHKRPELVIHHRFSGINKGITDLFGIYGAANIRLGLNFGITKDFMAGIGLEKNTKILELHGKYALLKQTKSGSMPVSISLYGNFGLSTKNSDYYGVNYVFIDRFSYFAQVIISRKFNNRISLMAAPSFSHFNSVEKDNFTHDAFGLMIGGRVKVYNEISFIAEYHHPFDLRWDEDYKSSYPNITAGFEIATGTHAFQLFVSSSDQIVPQSNYNANDWKIEMVDQDSDGDNELAGLAIGFNVIVKF